MENHRFSEQKALKGILLESCKNIFYIFFVNFLLFAEPCAVKSAKSQISLKSFGFFNRHPR